jgi:hypothetical protein
MTDPRKSEISKTPKTRISRPGSKAIGCEPDQKFRREWHNLGRLKLRWNAETGAKLVDSRLAKRDLFERSLKCFPVWEKLTEINSCFGRSDRSPFLKNGNVGNRSEGRFPTIEWFQLLRQLPANSWSILAALSVQKSIFLSVQFQGAFLFIDLTIDLQSDNWECGSDFNQSFNRLTRFRHETLPNLES